MKKIIFSLFFLFVTFSLFSQINMADSTVQVISYWDKNEKQTYLITQSSIKIKNATDTVDWSQISYLIDVQVIDSTANSYTLKMQTRNLKVEKLKDKRLEELYKISENSKVIIKTSEMGEYLELLNWKEQQEEARKVFAKAKEKFSDIKEIYPILDEMAKQYSTKETIEAITSKLINQFFSFHGGKYKLGEELNANLKVEDIFGGEPLDAGVIVLLDLIDPENDYSILRYWQITDEKQLTEAALNYTKKLAASMGADINMLSLPDAVNETTISSQIHGSTGWPIYSIQTTAITMGEYYRVDESIIEIQ